MTPDAALDREMGYTRWDESCQALYGVDTACRRRKGHDGDHATGYGAGRVRWSA